jgi:hypothetical protein
LRFRVTSAAASAGGAGGEGLAPREKVPPPGGGERARVAIGLGRGGCGVVGRDEGPSVSQLALVLLCA